MALGNSHDANGHHDEDPEPQQSLLSWAEFMADEPVKPKGRSRKAQAPSLSLLEWALTLDQEHEANRWARDARPQSTGEVTNSQ